MRWNYTAKRQTWSCRNGNKKSGKMAKKKERERLNCLSLFVCRVVLRVNRCRCRLRHLCSIASSAHYSHGIQKHKSYLRHPCSIASLAHYSPWTQKHKSYLCHLCSIVSPACCSPQPLLLVLRSRNHPRYIFTSCCHHRSLAVTAFFDLMPQYPVLGLQFLT